MAWGSGDQGRWGGHAWVRRAGYWVSWLGFQGKGRLWFVVKQTGEGLCVLSAGRRLGICAGFGGWAVFFAGKVGEKRTIVWVVPDGLERYDSRWRERREPS